MWNKLPFWMKWFSFLVVVFGTGAVVYFLQPKDQTPLPVPKPLLSCYVDHDGDGHGSLELAALLWICPSGYPANSDDCDDTRPEIYPGAEEACDGLDNDCDIKVDEGFDKFAFYADRDNDGHGNFDEAMVDCRQPTGYVETADDSDDTNPKVPGRDPQ